MNVRKIRQVVLDTETTGMNKIGVLYEGHRIIEIGAVEIINRRLTGRNFHVYIKPDRLIDPEAYSIHGISNDYLLNKPTFAQISDKFLKFISGSELIIHNAPFDIGFIDYEFSKLNLNIPKTEIFCKITDSLEIARSLFPGKRNSLDALCSRYAIDNTKRILHGALLDSQILAEVYLIMTGGQTAFTFSIESRDNETSYARKVKRIFRRTYKLKVIRANTKELAEHEHCLDLVHNNYCLWRDK
ncbi:DNA polymerase III subunit epsilon [Candidatus Profftia sp. (ex Adelges kitamiensis)]|uniref:DNA polymerase III subunit epsilon n=1 Tax=Candidatus Profftia sp. (ex Adelges kitamiensis) TaxID=2864218 RepID=UPI001CE2B1A6|nr:DNA polymerase III subunit epsilon [Candidatus Profftia sp. (ex Adelges kitamiensis)]